MVRLVSDGEGDVVMRVGGSSIAGVACKDAGRSERGVACTVLPATCMQAAERERGQTYDRY